MQEELYEIIVFVLKWINIFIQFVKRYYLSDSATKKKRVYGENELELFLKSFNDERANENIEKEFYDMETYREIMKNENNELETKWKKRILYETTPRGNVVMMYDAYKNGFVYYSDVSTFPYSVLNIIAMKYVRIFCCRDFFVDDSIHREHPSPLISLWEKEEEKEKKRSMTSNKMIFTKPKTMKEEKKNFNKFIYMGKTINFSFIEKKKKKHNVFKNNYEKLFEEQSFENKLSWKNFKLSKNKQIQ